VTVVKSRKSASVGPLDIGALCSNPRCGAPARGDCSSNRLTGSHACFGGSSLTDIALSFDPGPWGRIAP
jgi:hypothetical protein